MFNLFSNSFKTLFRFEKQSLNWKKEDFLLYARAFENGLRENQINKKVLFWLDSNHTAEYLTALTGCHLAKVETISLKNQNNQNVDENIFLDLLKKNQPELLIFSPNALENQKKRIDLIYNALPELNESLSGLDLELKQFPWLKKIVQTGFYQKNGMIKFQEFMFYDKNDKNKKIEQKKINSKLKVNLKENDLVYFFGDFEGKHEEVLDLSLGGLEKNYLSCFVSEEQLKELDLCFLNDLTKEQKLTIIADKEVQIMVKQKIQKEGVNYVNL